MPSTRSFYTRINPGTPPILDYDSQDNDIEMGMDDNEEQVITPAPAADKDNVMKHDIVSNVKKDRIIIAIDFGTTFSSVAYAVLPKKEPPENIDLDSVRCIGNYPGYESVPGVQDNRHDVPTELWYDDGSLDTYRQEIPDSSEEQTPDDENYEYSSSDDEISDHESSHFSENDGLEPSADSSLHGTHTTPSTIYWGYEVQQRLNMTNIHKDEARPLTRIKLNLDQKTETETLRTELRTLLNSLTKKKILRNGNDIYAHYLTRLLQHTKEQLLLEGELKQDMLFQFVLCVPAKWPMRGCRIMQLALEKAVIDTGISEGADRSVHDMFMISEPEAAAECILTEARSEIFVSSTYPFHQTPLTSELA
jgi:hypothetical protein